MSNTDNNNKPKERKILGINLKSIDNKNSNYNSSFNSKSTIIVKKGVSEENNNNQSFFNKKNIKIEKFGSELGGYKKDKKILNLNNSYKNNVNISSDIERNEDVVTEENRNKSHEKTNNNSYVSKPNNNYSQNKISDYNSQNKIRNLNVIFVEKKGNEFQEISNKTKISETQKNILQKVQLKDDGKTSALKHIIGKNKKNHFNDADEENNPEKAVDKKTSGTKKDSRSGHKKFSTSELVMLDDDNLDDETVIKSLNARHVWPVINKKQKKHKNSNFKISNTEKVIKEVVIPDFITVQELANRMAEKVGSVIKELMKLGIMATINHSIDADTAELIASEFGHKPKRITIQEVIKQLINEKEDLPEELKHRAPVVTIMGHVDHGKTSLLDALRETDVTAGEHGGITQHIGAYKVNMSNGKFITFLDTPGHEAFTAMRMRGAKVTDIVVIVVAGDDGIKAQTIEAIHHAKAAEVPIIVAINKIDKHGINIEGVKNSLLNYELVPEDMGGDIMVIPVSAHKKIGLDKLEEAILLQAELLDLKANYTRSARGSVIEAKIDKNRGAIVSLLVQKGTLKIGDIVIAGSVTGKIKSMHDDKGLSIKEAHPSIPVEVLGLSQAPIAGDDFLVLNDEKTAKELAAIKIQQEKDKKLAASIKGKMSMEQMFMEAKANTKQLPLIIKTDVQGSVEAIVQSLEKFIHTEVKIKIIHDAVGGITESDVTLAGASKAMIVGFNVRANANAKDMAKELGVEIRYYSVIYDLLQDIKDAMSGLLSPIKKEKVMGYAEIRKVFNLTKYGKIAGCYVTEGNIKRGSHVRLLRDNVVIFEGKLKSLKHGQEDAREMKAGFECGIAIEGYDGIIEKDMIEAFEITHEDRKVEF